MTDNLLPSVSVRHIPQYNAIYMSAERYVNPPDVARAFVQITEILNASPGPMVVIVDLLNDPNIPFGVTFNAALDGPAGNPKLKEWLILGKNPSAQLIERTLSSVTGRGNARWFNTREEICAYLQNSPNSAA